MKETSLLTEKEVADLENIIMKQLEVRRDQITPEARIEEDLGADSLDKVEIAMQTDEHFNISLPDEDLERVVTVGDLLQALERCLGRRR